MRNIIYIYKNTPPRLLFNHDGKEKEIRLFHDSVFECVDNVLCLRVDKNWEEFKNPTWMEIAERHKFSSSGVGYIVGQAESIIKQLQKENEELKEKYQNLGFELANKQYDNEKLTEKIKKLEVK
jgi:hypothetical protein